MFPKPVAALISVKKAVDIALPHIGKEDVCKRLTALISLYLLSYPVFACPAREDHSSVTCSIVANKFIRPFCQILPQLLQTEWLTVKTNK